MTYQKPHENQSYVSMIHVEALNEGLSQYYHVLIGCVVQSFL